MIKIPFVHLQAQYESIKKDIDNAIASAVAGFQFCRGSQVTEFENAFATLHGVNHCIGTGNGTDALFLALKALGIKGGDEVITPAFSWISSAEVIALCGAQPVFADVDEITLTLDAQDVRKKITDRTRAVIAVHLYGQICQVDELSALCKDHNLYLVEDCAQAHLTRFKEGYAGTFGHISAFSFYPTKNLGAYGDAGCVLTDNDAVAERVRRLANHGALQKDDHLMEGSNSRLDTIQAAVLLAKLPHLAKWNRRRDELAQIYVQHLKAVKEITLPAIQPNSVHSFHLFVIRARERDRLKQYLHDRGVQCLIHFPRALPNLPAYSYLAPGHKYPVADQLQDQVLSLPIYPELPAEAVEYICAAIKEFYNS
jgi:dTDP-4-amino-4,6-dideoxygalactose transaminase